MKHKSLWNLVSARMDCALRDRRGNRARRAGHARSLLAQEAGEPGWRRTSRSSELSDCRPPPAAGRCSAPFVSCHTDCSPEPPTGRTTQLPAKASDDPVTFSGPVQFHVTSGRGELSPRREHQASRHTPVCCTSGRTVQHHTPSFPSPPRDDPR